MDFLSEEAYPGYEESIQLQEYESIKEKINEKFDCDLSAIQVRSEFEIAYNKLFENLLQSHSHEMFKIIYVLMDCFNISEVKAVRYLSKDNKEKIRAFAINNCNTKYYQQIEKNIKKEKLEKKGITFFEHDDIGGLFL